MVQGYDRREVSGQSTGVKPVQPVNAPMSMVMRPVPSSVSASNDGLDQLTKALGVTSQFLTSYSDKKDKEAELAGQTAYAAGKAEQEVIAGGNRATTAGFMAMKTKVAGNEWFARKVVDLENTDKMQEPADYQAGLLKDFSNIMDDTAGADTYSRNLMGAIASERVPQLVAMHVKANAAWKEDETARTSTDMLVSEALTPTPDDTTGAKKQSSIKELLSHVRSTLPRDKAEQVITQALARGLEADDNSIQLALGADHKVALSEQESLANVPAGIYGYVKMKESGTQHDSAGRLLQGPMTYTGERAQGEMQVMPATAKDPGYGVKPAKDNSPEELKRVGLDLIGAWQKHFGGDGTLALMAYNSGPNTVEDHMDKVGDPRTGEISMQDFVKSFPAAETRKYVSDWMNGQNSTGTYVTPQARNNKASAILAMQEAGFSSAAITNSMNAIDKYDTRMSNKFSAVRETYEDTLLHGVETSGNLAAAYDTIQKFADQNNMPPAWGNGLANRARESLKKYQTAQATITELTAAISTNSVGQLSGEKQKHAIDMQTTLAAQEVMQNPSIKDDDKSTAVMQKKIQFLRKNNITDTRMADSIQSGLMAETIGKDGQPTPAAIGAIMQLRMLASIGGQQEVSKYLRGNSGEGTAAAKLYELTLQGVEAGNSIAQSLVIASHIRDRELSVGEQKGIQATQEQLAPILDGILEQHFPSVLKHMVMNKELVGGFEQQNAEEAKAKSNPDFMNKVQALVNYRLRANPTESIDIATKMVMKYQLGSEMEVVQGNVLMSPDGTTFSKAMGLNPQEAQEFKEHPNALGYTLYKYLNTNGDKLFGQKFKDTTHTWFGTQNPDTKYHGLNPFIHASDWFSTWGEQSVQNRRDAWRNDMPSMNMTFVGGPHPGIMVGIYGDTAQTYVRDTSFIPMKVLGNIFRDDVVAPKTTGNSGIVTQAIGIVNPKYGEHKAK